MWFWKFTLQHFPSLRGLVICVSPNLWSLLNLFSFPTKHLLLASNTHAQTHIHTEFICLVMISVTKSIESSLISMSFCHLQHNLRPKKPCKMWKHTAAMPEPRNIFSLFRILSYGFLSVLISIEVIAMGSNLY